MQSWTSRVSSYAMWKKKFRVWANFLPKSCFSKYFTTFRILISWCNILVKEWQIVDLLADWEDASPHPSLLPLATGLVKYVDNTGNQDVTWQPLYMYMSFHYIYLWLVIVNYVNVLLLKIIFKDDTVFLHYGHQLASWTPDVPVDDNYAHF